MNRFLLRCFLSLISIFAAGAYNAAMASHLYGGDIGYTHVSGNTYRITLAVYGDCSGSAFSSLIGSSATVTVLNGTTTVTSLTLPQDAPPLEVTPVCPAQANLTVCNVPMSTIPGIKRFSYSVLYNIPSLSTGWKFRYSLSARSNNITNIQTPTGTSMTLEATLNNTVGPNSTPLYTTIPTPFFCVNKPASYNPGTVDPDGNTLNFSLITGLNGTGVVTYLGTFTGIDPLAYTPATFFFSPTNGQIDFTPNITQRALVVSKVSEYNGATLVGTTMREMIFVVLPCNNNPPGGTISSPSSSTTLINGTTVSICNESGLFGFNINPVDLDGNNITVTAAGLPAGATFNVTNNNTAAPIGYFSWDVTGVAPGTYSFFVTFLDDGCPLASKQTVAYTITVLPNPTLTFSIVSPATCLAKAVFTVTPVNATSPYVIKFGTTTRTGVTGTITDSLTYGTYTFTVTALNGCSHDTSITIASPPLPNVDAVIKNNTCNATADGAVTITGYNTAAPYTYALGTGGFSATNTFGPLATGTYVFHVKDFSGCIKDTSIAVNDSLTVHSAITVTNVSCNGTSTGSIQVVGNSGISPYRYAFGTGPFSSVNTLSTLVAGTYAVHIKDTLGCFSDTSAIVNEPTKLGIGATIIDVKCNGQSTGSVTINGTGGTPAYTFAIGTGTYSATATFGGLSAGTYNFHVRDSKGCQADTTITIIEPTPLAFTVVPTNVLCNGGSTGTITVNASGGTPAYTYAINTGLFGASNVFNALNANTYAIHLKDNNACVKDTSIVITQPAVLGISYVAVNPLCNAANNGTITISGTGGTTAYSYALDANPFVASGAMTGLAPGTYAVHIKDANGCTKDTTATLTEPTPVTVTATAGQPRCTPLVNGIVTLAAAGGTPGYTYARGTNPYGASPTFTGIGSGTYIFHVKDTKGCVKDTTITLVDSLHISATTIITNVKCINGSDGSIDITPAGGITPYKYAVNTNPYATTNPIINLIAGTYILHIKDSIGCILDTAQTITQPTVIVPGVVITQPLCYQGSDGFLTMSATGGTPGYTYAIGTGTYQAAPALTGLAAGTYLVHVKDFNNCVHDTTVTIGQPTKLIYTFVTMTHLICNGDSSGTVTVHAAGATPPYAYAADANPYQPTNVLTGLKAGIRPIHLKDNNGCIHDTTVLLFEPTKVHLKMDTIITPTCEGYKDGSVLISAYGGNPGYTYSTTNTTYDTQKYYHHLPEGTYTYYAKDARGCIADTTVTLIGYPHIRVDAVTKTDPSCNGYSNGRFDLYVSGGNPNLTYYMKSPADTNQTGKFDSLIKGKYSVHIVDNTGCFKDTSVTLDEPDSLIAGTIITPNDCIGYDDGGGVEVTARGGTNPYSYLWSTTPRQTSDRINGLPNGKYSVIVTDAHNCKDTTLAVVPYDNCCRPYIVDAFTPNGDGKNDRFRVLFKGDVKLISFSIYNRYGQRLFYTTSTDVGWDGTWNDVNQDLGTYFYSIKLICGNKGDNIQEYKGDITLIR